MTPNNEPAFPVPDVHHVNGEVSYGSYGMTLRDWFAGNAMKQFVDQPDHTMCIHEKAKSAYAMADAMLWARSNKQNQPTPTQPQ